jgi:hypothetical protein
MSVKECAKVNEGKRRPWKESQRQTKYLRKGLCKGIRILLNSEMAFSMLPVVSPVPMGLNLLV